MRGIECAFIGYVSRDTSLRISKADKPYCNLNVGVQTGNQTDDGKNEVQWIRVACFGETAERVAASVSKSDKVYVEGSITLNRWKTADGEERADLNCAAWKVEALGKIGHNKPKRNHQSSDFNAPIERETSREFDDAIPF